MPDTILGEHLPRTLDEHREYVLGLLRPKMPNALRVFEELLAKPEPGVREQAARAVVGLARRGALKNLPPELGGRFVALLERAREVRRQQAEMRRAARGRGI